MKQTLILGNIITVDEKRPFAKAAVVKNGEFSYIGSAEEAKKIAGPDAKVLDSRNCPASGLVADLSPSRRSASRVRRSAIPSGRAAAW